MDQMGSQKGMDELEVLDSDSQKVASLLSALPRVEAPSNFEFRVKAGIANGAPSGFGLLPFLKTAAPFALVLFVVTFGILYYQRPVGTATAPLNDVSMSAPIIRPVQSESAPAADAPGSSTVTNPPQETGSAQARPASADSRQLARSHRSVGSAADRDGGNSKVVTLQPARVIMPPGMESANPQKRTANTAPGSTSDTPVREVLGMFGIEGEFANGGWKVRSVKESSFGYRAKILAGDVIESIDGRAVKSDAKLKGGAKTFTVRRDGKLIALPSGN